MQKVVAAVVVIAVLLVLAVANSFAHCGKMHEDEGRISIAQLSPEDLAFELKIIEVDPDVTALERAIEAQEEAENQERLEQLIQDLRIHRGHKESEHFRVENGRFDPIPPAKIQMK